MRSGIRLVRAVQKGPGDRAQEATPQPKAAAMFISVVLTMTMSGAAVACTEPDTDAFDPGWATEAEVWSSDFRQATSDDAGSFLDEFWHPNLTWDIRSMIGASHTLHGHNAFTLAAAMHPSDADNATPEGPIFVATDGLVSLVSYDWEPTGMSHVDASAPAHLVDVLQPIGSRGAEHVITAMAIGDRRDRLFGSDLDGAAEMAAAWLDGWRRGGRSPLDELYAADAVVTDSIGGLSATGADEIEAVRADLDWPDIDVMTLDDSSPALYPLLTSEGAVRGLVMVVEVGTCPGRLAVILESTGGRVTTDTRYRAITDARRCLPADDLPDGWWTGRTGATADGTAPHEDLESPTGSLSFGSHTLTLCNSTPALDDFAEWGLERFDLAGVGPPPVSELVFSTASECCRDARGEASLIEGAYDVLLCLDEAATCRDRECTAYQVPARHALLHEFAHVWMAANLDEEAQARITERFGLIAWSDQDVPWADRAIEHAAETIVWGLFDEPFTPTLISRRTTGELGEAFRLLTGVEPLQPSALTG